jgi:hypothetical protein
MIDSAVESPESLRRIAAMLAFAATQMEMGPLVAAVPAGTVAPVVAPVVPAAPIAPSPPAEVMKADAGHASELRDPAQVFGGAAPNPSVPTAPLPIAGNAETSGASTVTTGTAEVELDGAGLPWDQRIHSTPAKKNANGLWRMRRAVDPNLIQTVEAELRVKYPAKVAPVQTTVPLPPGPAAPDVPAPPVAGGAVPSVPAPPAPVTLPGNPAPGVPTGAVVAPGVPDGAAAFRAMMDKYSKEMGPNGRLNKAAMGPLFQQLGIGGWGDLHKRAELIPAVVAECERLAPVAA